MKLLFTVFFCVASCLLSYAQNPPSEELVYVSEISVDNRPLDKSLPVYSMPGNASVTQGSASYSIPIQMPKGINGMEPRISISYSSGGYNGLLGVGWNLTGLGVISRAGESFYLDDNTSNMSLEDEDHLALNGQRLILENGPNLAIGSKYKTVNETNSIVEMADFGGFVVTEKNGFKSYYGLTSNSRVHFNKNSNGLSVNVDGIWLLEKVEDQFGNFMEYSYIIDQTAKEWLLDKIVYTKRPGLTVAECEVQFEYALRKDRRVGYKYGNRMEHRSILTGIKTIHDNKVFTEYGLNYSWRTGITGEEVSRLVEIEFQSLGSSVNATVIEWEPSANEVDYRNRHFLNPDIQIGFDGKSREVDLNGDGLTDFLTLEHRFINERDCWVGLVKKSIADHEFKVVASIKNKIGNGFTKINLVNPFLSQYKPDECERNPFSQIYPGDFNGDGLNDFILHRVSGKPTMYAVDLYLNDQSNPGSFILDRTYQINDNLPVAYDQNNTPNNGDLANAPFPLIVGDFDGDGIMDFSYSGSDRPTDRSYSSHTLESMWVIYRGTSESGFSKELVDINSHFNGNAVIQQIRTGDFNGDTKTDVLFVAATTSVAITVDHFWSEELIFKGGFPNDYNHFHLGDFNADGITDILWFHPVNKDWKLNHGTGSGWEAVHTNLSFVVEDLDLNMHGTRPGALNGPPIPFARDLDLDGRSDIIFFEKQNVNSFLYTIYYNKVTGWTQISHSLPAEDVGDFPSSAVENFHWGDFLGTGNLQVLYERDVYQVGNYGFLLSFRENDQSKNIGHILNGYNQKTSFFYNRLTNYQNPIYNKRNIPDYKYPTVCSAIPLLVVSGLKELDFQGKVFRDISYSFKDLRINLQGAGVFGFMEHSAIDNLNSIEVEHHNSIVKHSIPASGATYPLLPTLTKTRHTSGQMLSENEVEYFNDDIWVMQYQGFNYNVLLKRRISRDYLTGVASTKSYTYDGDNNVIQISSKVYSDHILTNPFVERKEQFFSKFVAAGSWYPWQATTIRLEAERDGQSIVSTSKDVTFDPVTGKITRDIRNPGTSAEIATEFKYTVAGNLEEVKNVPAGMPSKVTIDRTVWQNNHRLVDHTINRMGWIIQHDIIDPISGEVLKSTDYNGLVTRYEYDDFKRLFKSVSPTNVVTESQYGWNANGTLPQALYSITETTSNGPDVKGWYDGIGREVRSETQNQSGNWVNSDSEYMVNGDLKRTSLPYIQGQSPSWINYSYDYLGRVTKILSPTQSTSTVYSGATSIVTNDYTGQTKSTTVDVSGKTISIADEGGVIEYSYNSWGEVSGISDPTRVIHMEYDNFGRQVSLVDRAMGVMNYEYFADGSLRRQTDQKGNVFDMTYDKLGRLVLKSGPEGDYTYGFDDQFLGSSDYSFSPSGSKSYINYDAFGRVLSVIEELDNTQYQVSYVYNNIGQVDHILYPNSLRINYFYTPRGYLSKIETSAGKLIWEFLNENSFGQITEYKLGHTTWEEGFNTLNGFPEFIRSTNLWDYHYGIDAVSGNLESRTDNVRGLAEDFTYDNLDRLLQYGLDNFTVDYDTHGNITAKTDVGDYKNDLPTGRTMEILNNPGTISHNLQMVTYNSFNSVASISEGQLMAFFTYGADDQRRKMVLYENGTLKQERQYIFTGLFEREFNLGKWQEYCYIETPTGTAVEISSSSRSSDLYFLLKDYQGSILALVNETGGSVVEEYSFDPWGNRRNPNDWQTTYLPGQNSNTFSSLINRGFTGHEHLDMFGLINMNGRLYEPLLGRMLSPDNNIQDPTSSQNLNRYSYVINNPLKYNDPSGEAISFATMAIIAGATTGAVSAAGSYIGYYAQTGNWDTKSFLTSVGTGVIVGGVFGAFLPNTAFVGWAANLPVNATGAFIGSMMPSAGFSSGDWTFSVSPALAFGNANGFGVNLGATYEGERDFVFGAAVGFTRYDSYQGRRTSTEGLSRRNISTVERRFSFATGWSGSDGSFVFGSTYFWHGSGNEFNQLVGRLSFDVKGLGGSYENDGFPFNWIGYGLGDGNDRWRTAAAGVFIKNSAGTYGIGFNLFTGDPGPNMTPEPVNGHPDLNDGTLGGQYSGGTANKFRLGAAYMNINGWRIGKDSEQIRHQIQNKKAHTIRYQPWFKVLSIPDARYNQFLNNPFTAW